MKHRIYKLQGQVQFYAWGGYDFIPSLLGFDNTQHKPCAEYWLGTHNSGAGKLETEDGPRLWKEVIEDDRMDQLGNAVYERFGHLPYLLKVLDVREMLSIQVHPTKAEAEKGFAREENEGIAIDAKNRNYKDDNHKPEVMIALGDFWLLHGFKKEEDLLQVLQSIPEFNGFVDLFNEKGYYGLYKHVMELPQQEVDELLLPLVRRELSIESSKDEPGYWVNKLYNGEPPGKDLDRGIFSIYFFNIVHLKEGEGIFQAAGVPHAYLEGQNVELMANSDNVLRGGLTPKHIDVPELLKHVNFEAVEPEVLGTEETEAGEKMYCLPVEDFGICALHLEHGREYVNKSRSPETFLLMEGEVHAPHLTCKKGDAFVVFPNTDYTIRAITDSVLYKAYVPVKGKELVNEI